MISALLYFGIGYLLLISLVMAMNLRDFKPMPLPGNSAATEEHLVSVCIPARNEAPNIKRAVLSVLNQTYRNLEILVLDDQSSDQTPKILDELKRKYPEKLKVFKGQPKPDDWLGKSWACHQLSTKAGGDLLFFIDADVWLEPKAVAKTVYSMQYFSVDFITLWPIQKVETFWERVVIPIIYYGLLGLLPARYVHHNPRWLPASLRERMAPLFAAACGQCMIFTRATYKAIGGHESVKQDIVEDVALAKQIKRHRYRMRMFHGRGAAQCRMYRSGKEMWHGFRKNFLGLFNDSVPAFVTMSVVNFIVYILPVFAFAAGLWHQKIHWAVLSAIALLLMILHRMILAVWYNFEMRMALLHPLGVFWFHALGIAVLKDCFWGTRASWKNRPTMES